tara:strand:+ start:272 stop:490 length:219 start_codon:yes stop_codon:yes gene_type:complete
MSRSTLLNSLLTSESHYRKIPLRLKDCPKPLERQKGEIREVLKIRLSALEAYLSFVNFFKLEYGYLQMVYAW